MAFTSWQPTLIWGGGVNFSCVSEMSYIVLAHYHVINERRFTVFSSHIRHPLITSHECTITHYKYFIKIYYGYKIVYIHARTTARRDVTRKHLTSFILSRYLLPSSTMTYVVSIIRNFFYYYYVFFHPYHRHVNFGR